MTTHAHLQASFSARSHRGRLLFQQRRGQAVLSLAVAILAFLAHTNRAWADDENYSAKKIATILSIIDKYRAELAIDSEVQISMVPHNKRLLSVERCKDKRDTYIILVDENFSDSLDYSDLCAALAHELGHVWIFTHHPYLQTELLANQIAQKVVPKEQLERVYEKVWKNQGHKGEMEKVLGEAE